MGPRPKRGPRRKARLERGPGESNFEEQTKNNNPRSMASTTASRAAPAEADTACDMSGGCGSWSAKSGTKCFALYIFVCAICST